MHLLDDLKSKSFSELAALPARERLHPENLPRGWRVFRICERLASGDLRVSIEATKRFLLVFVHKSLPGFNMEPDGTVVEDDDGPDE
jgi:hypothetical protein